MYKLCQVHKDWAGCVHNTVQWLGMCTTLQEAWKSCSRLLEDKGGEGSPGMADEHDETWEMARLLGQVLLKKKSLFLSTLHWVKTCDQEDSVSLCKHKEMHGGKWWEKGRSKRKSP